MESNHTATGLRRGRQKYRGVRIVIDRMALYGHAAPELLCRTVAWVLLWQRLRCQTFYALDLSATRLGTYGETTSFVGSLSPDPAPAAA